MLNSSTGLNRPRAKPLPLLPPPRTPLPHRSSSSTRHRGFARPILSAIICHYTSPFEPWPCCMASDSKCGRRVALSSGTRSTTYCLKVLLRTGRPRSLPCVTLKCVKSQDVGGDADGGTAPVAFLEENDLAVRRLTSARAHVASSRLMVISLVLGVLAPPDRHRSDSAQQPQQIWSRIPGQLPVAPTDSEIYTSSAFERAWTGGAVAKQVAGRRVSIGVRSWT